jgi:hypothetical protein
VSKKWRDIINQQGAFCQQDMLVVLCIHDRQFRVALGEFNSCRTRLTFKQQPHRGLIVSEDDHIFQVGFQGKNVLVINHCPNGHCVSMSKHRWLSYDLDLPKGWCAYVDSRSEQASRSEVSDSFSWRAGSGFGPWDRICVQETQHTRYRLVGYRSKGGATACDTLVGPFRVPESKPIVGQHSEVLTVDGDVYTLGEGRIQILNRDNGADHIIDEYWAEEGGKPCAMAPTIVWSCVRTADKSSR